MVFALPAASVPPISVTRTSLSEGRPRWASSMAGTVVTKSSSMIRGLVSATSPRAIVPTGRRPRGGTPRWSSLGSAAAEVTPASAEAGSAVLAGAVPAVLAAAGSAVLAGAGAVLAAAGAVLAGGGAVVLAGASDVGVGWP